MTTKIFGTAYGESGLNPFDVSILLQEHMLTQVWEGDCCQSDQAQCNCGWQGDPSSYTEHLIFLLGLTSKTTEDWLIKFSEVGDQRSYADIFDDPREVKRRKMNEAKERKAVRERERLVRMAANGDAAAAERLNETS